MEALLDHVAFAVDELEPALAELTGAIGGTVVSKDHAPGLDAVVVGFPGALDGIRLELISPRAGSEGEFLRRFLHERGQVPHHLTLWVPDRDAAIQQVRAVGIEPFGVMGDERWREAFLHPRDTGGVLLQVAEFDRASADAFRASGSGASITQVDLRSRDPERTLDLLAALGGRDSRAGAEGLIHWTNGAAARITPGTDGHGGIVAVAWAGVIPDTRWQGPFDPD